ncbi:hypothetical protein, partial [Methanoculleus sp.]|uniref:hypothetical protein n=1 Tax=Methanoculleus sp. TaxID=90427 RepID=UPI0025E0A5D4
FDIGKREQAKVDAYYKAQKEKAALNRVKKQWQESIAYAPKDTPKTLTGYVKLKAKDNEEFKELRAKVKTAKQ